MKIHKVVAGSVLAAGVGVAGLFGAGMASADVTNNKTTNDATGFGVTNHMKNGPGGNDGPTFNGDRNGVGGDRRTQTGAEVAAISGVTARDANVNNIVSGQGSPTDVADWGPINDNPGGNG